MRDLEIRKSGDVNPLRRWYVYRNPLRVVLNFLVIYGCRYIPSLELKNMLYRLIGIKVGRNVSVGLGAVFDIFFPELIEVGENSVIGYNAAILAHEFLVDELRKGRVRIGRNVLIGAKALILPGVEVGDNARISACSLVNTDVPANSFFGGVPAKEIKK
ncbi:MAG: acyltransferase [Candidatus Altiarchaeota archaeon]|nr:acyltransferase [Candidatus Altiarchaeota archaeon]